MLSVENPGAVSKHSDVAKAIPCAQLSNFCTVDLTLEFPATNNKHALAAIPGDQNTLSRFANFATCIVHNCRQLPDSNHHEQNQIM